MEGRKAHKEGASNYTRKKRSAYHVRREETGKRRKDCIRKKGPPNYTGKIKKKFEEEREGKLTTWEGRGGSR